MTTDVDGMLERMSAVQFCEWQACYAIDPWGPERADLRSGIECSVMDACHRTKGRVKPPKDYMVNFDSPQERQQQKEQEMRAKVAGYRKSLDKWRAKK